MQSRHFIKISMLPFLLFFPEPSLAEPLTTSTQDFDTQFGVVVGSEKGCGLTYDQKVIESLITDNVAATDMDWSSTFNAYVRLTDYSIGEMTAVQKLAHCKAISQNARNLGLIK